MNKKGSAITDLLVWIVIGFVVLIFMGAWVFGFNLVTESLRDAAEQSQNSGVNITYAVESSFGAANSAMGYLRIISFIIIFMLGFSILISNFLVKANPVFFIVYVLVIIGAVIVSVPVSNAYEDLMTNNVLGATLTTFTGGSWIYLNLPVWVTVIGIFGAIFLFIGIVRDRETGGSVF